MVPGVSIPFKREGTGERRFNFGDKYGVKVFQFPSNGKARVNYRRMAWQLGISGNVSIPFKREGTGEQSESD